jgi:hypothetical protein
MVVVIDTNVFIDAFFHNDVMCQSILKLIICNKIQLAVSIPIVDEISNIFTEHFIKLEADLESKKYIEISKNRILALANTYNPIKNFQYAWMKMTINFLIVLLKPVLIILLQVIIICFL